MFFCHNCSEKSAPGQPTNKIVTERRQRNYENSVYDKMGRFKGMKHSSGWEIVKEVDVCPKCFTALTGKEAKVVELAPVRTFHPRFKDERKKYKKWNEVKRDNRQPNRQPPPQNNKRPPQVQVVNPIKIVKE